MTKLEPQALLEEYVGKMVYSGRRGGLNSGPCLRGRSEFYASRCESKLGEAGASSNEYAASDAEVIVLSLNPFDVKLCIHFMRQKWATC